MSYVSYIVDNEPNGTPKIVQGEFLTPGEIILGHIGNDPSVTPVKYPTPLLLQVQLDESDRNYHWGVQEVHADSDLNEQRSGFELLVRRRWGITKEDYYLVVPFYSVSRVIV